MTEVAQHWTIVSISTGEVLDACFITADTNIHPKDCGWAWDEEDHQAIKIAQAPDTAYQSWTGSAWASNLSAYKDKKWAEAEDYRDSRYCEPLPIPTISDGTFVAKRDTEGQMWIDRFCGAATTAVIAQAPFQITLKDYNKVPHTISAQDILTINADSVRQQALCFAAAETIRAMIQAATTRAELDAIDVAQGYPPQYEGE
jgi:hypothetical protein